MVVVCKENYTHEEKKDSSCSDITSSSISSFFSYFPFPLSSFQKYAIE